MSFQNSRNTYGASRICANLKAEGKKVGKKRISWLMQENQLVPKRKKSFKVTTKSNSDHTAAPNLWTASGWLYVAAIMDLYSRKIVGLSMNKRMTKQLVINAFNNAIIKRGLPDSLIYHSDRGSQYTSEDFKQTLLRYGVIISNSGTGNCYDNAAMESFFASLKTKCVYHEQYKTREEAKLSIFDYCEIFYNNQRRHSTLGYKTPSQFESI